MYGGGGFGGGGAGGGFGYDSKPRQGGFLPGDGEPDSPSKRRTQSSQSLTPVTIRMIQMASHVPGTETHKLDGKDLGQVTFIGLILHVTETSTNITLTVDDGTGKITVKTWVDSKPDDPVRPSSAGLWRQGMYVRVVGAVKDWNSDRNINGFRLLPVNDFNEITFHMLDTIHVHLYNTRGPLTPAAGAGGAGAVGGGMAAPVPGFGAYSSFGAGPGAGVAPGMSGGVGGGYGAAAGGYGGAAGGYGAATGGYGAATGGMGGAFGATSGNLSPLERAVLEAVKAQSRTDVGASLDYVLRTLSHTASEMDIRRALDMLTGECHIYTTHDAQHFKATDI